MSQWETSDNALAKWRDVLLVSIGDTIEEWIRNNPCIGTEIVTGFHPFIHPIIMRKWLVARDHMGAPVFVYEDRSLSVMVDIAKRRFLWGKLITLEARRRFPLCADMVPLSPRILGALGTVAYATRAASSP